MQAHLLSTNKFNMPTVLDGSNAAYMHIIHLLLLEPGKFQSHPDMGVGLRSKYRFNNDANMLRNLQADIKNQMEKYLPTLLPTCDVIVGILSDHRLGIIINTTNGAYVVSFNNFGDVSSTADRRVLEELL